MENNFITFEQVTKLYPNEWVLLGNPEIENSLILGGVVLYHSKDKKEVCYIGRDKTADFSKVTIAYAGDLKKNRKIGILRKI